MNATHGPEPARDCCSGERGTLLPAEVALERILAAVEPVTGTERLGVRQAMDRVLAQDLVSDIDVPPHVNSAMDGYALRGSDLPAEGERAFAVVGTVLAGQRPAIRVAAGQCVRIMTGAALPAGTDTVVMQEATRREGDRVWLRAGHRPGQHVRQAGEDLARGEVAIAAGTRLGPADLGLAASLGRAELAVTRPLRVAFFSTGDELQSVGNPLAAGEIYDSNRYTLHGMLHRLGVAATDLGVVRDDPEALREAFVTAGSIADVVITSGGVSVGEADYVREILDEVGEVGFWRLAIRPGRPLAVGRIGDAAFFGLPGNPVAVMVTFYQFVRPALRKMMGERDWRPRRFRARAASDIRKRPGRTEFQRGVLARDDAGETCVHLTGAQGSGILHSMSRADCFIVLPHDAGPVAAGELVEVEPFHGLT